MVIGWTLIYLTHMPQDFYFGSALSPEQSPDTLTALYLSLVTLATLGFSDVTPADPGLRLLTPFEALLGFVLLTTAISWIVQVYPAPGRRRSVANRLSILQSCRATGVLAGGEPCVASRMLEGVTEDAIQAETDLLQYAESYSFLEEEEEMSLARNPPLRAGAGGSRKIVIFAGSPPRGRDARCGRREPRRCVDRAYLRTGCPTPEVLASYSADHGFGRHA